MFRRVDMRHKHAFNTPNLNFDTVSPESLPASYWPRLTGKNCRFWPPSLILEAPLKTILIGLIWSDYLGLPWIRPDPLRPLAFSLSQSALRIKMSKNRVQMVPPSRPTKRSTFCLSLDFTTLRWEFKSRYSRKKQARHFVSPFIDAADD